MQISSLEDADAAASYTPGSDSLCTTPGGPIAHDSSDRTDCASLTPTGGSWSGPRRLQRAIQYCSRLISPPSPHSLLSNQTSRSPELGPAVTRFDVNHYVPDLVLDAVPSFTLDADVQQPDEEVTGVGQGTATCAGETQPWVGNSVDGIVRGAGA